MGTTGEEAILALGGRDMVAHICSVCWSYQQEHGKRPARLLINVSIWEKLTDEQKAQLCVPAQPMVVTRQQYFNTLPGACLVVPVDENFTVGNGL
jgi:hypothetical protein